MKLNAKQVGILLSLIPALNALRCIYLHLWISYVIKEMVADFLVINGIWRETCSNPNIKTGLMF